MDMICDRCGREIAEEEANDAPPNSDWAGAILCNDCYAEVAFEQEGE